MSLLSYVVNWDELALSLATDVTVSVEDIGGAIDSNLPDVIDLLEQIRDILYLNGAKYRNYDQKIEGFHLRTNESIKTIDWTNEQNCYLTGITCSHSHVEAVDDFFMLSLIKLDEETGEEAIELIFEKVYLKDALQHKYFNKYFPVPAGVTVRITHNNPSNLNKHVWYDLEYLEFFGLREDEEWNDIPIYEPPEPVLPTEPEEPNPEEPEIPVDPPVEPEEPEEPIEPPSPSDDLLYLCDNSINANTLNTDFFNWNQLTLDFMIHQEGYHITGEFWEDRNLLLDFFYNLSETPDPYNDYRKNKITTSDFHKFLFKSLNDSRLKVLVLSQNWQQFKAWADINLSCLTDLQKGSLFYTVKSKIITNLFASGEGFIEGKVPDVICKYLDRLPYRVVDWIDYNDVKQEAPGSNSVTGAYAVDIFTSEYPTLLDAFSSYVNMEPQTLNFSIQSLSASNPSDYVNAEGDFWGAQVPSSIVDWTNYITEEFSSGDAETHKGLVASETAVHELGHCVDYYYTKDLERFLTSSNEWYSIGGWTFNQAMESGFDYLVKDKPSNQTGGMPKTNTGHEAPVSDYGCSQPMEDFAEAFNVYIINPSLLRDKYPKRFAYMEKYVKPLL